MDYKTYNSNIAITVISYIIYILNLNVMTYKQGNHILYYSIKLIIYDNIGNKKGSK